MYKFGNAIVTTTMFYQKKGSKRHSSSDLLLANIRCVPAGIYTCLFRSRYLPGACIQATGTFGFLKFN